MKKVVFLTLVAVMVLSTGFFSLRASPAAAGGTNILEFETMVGVPRPYTGSANPIRGINGGGLPWVVSSAQGELKADGKIEVKVTGLVLDPTDPAVIASGRGGTNPSATFKAVVSCLSKDASGAPITVNVATNTFAASPTGNSKIEDRVTLPHPCIAPIVFVTNPTGSWFAATGTP